ncbi:DNA helicase, partial [Tanacetum coccineum]
TTLDALDQLAVSAIMETQIEDKASGEKLRLKTSMETLPECTLWDEMATHFGEADIHSIEQPVIIAISSCWVSKYTDYQLYGSSATYYYLNPKIPEAEESRAL